MRKESKASSASHSTEKYHDSSGTLSERVYDSGDDRSRGGNGKSDEIFPVGPARILRYRVGLHVETRQTGCAAQQKEKGEEIAGAMIRHKSTGLYELRRPR